jgi:hypothetical protein
MESKSFFNLPQATLLNGLREKSFFEPPQKHAFETNWKTFEEQQMSRQSLFDVFAGTIPAIRQKAFLSREECAKMVKVLESHDIVRRLRRSSATRFGVIGVLKSGSRAYMTLTMSGLVWGVSASPKPITSTASEYLV